MYLSNFERQGSTFEHSKYCELLEQALASANSTLLLCFQTGKRDHGTGGVTKAYEKISSMTAHIASCLCKVQACSKLMH